MKSIAARARPVCVSAVFDHERGRGRSALFSGPGAPAAHAARRAALPAGWAALLVTALLAGCAGLPLPDKPVRPQPYDLGPPLAMAADAAPRIASAIAIGRVEASSAVDGTNITYRLLYESGDVQPRPYALARWIMSPPQLLSQRLREAFSATRAVVDPGAGLAPVELRFELDQFAQLFSAPNASEGVVRLRVTATAPAARDERLLGQRTFTVSRPAPTPDAAGGVAALRAASDEVVREVVAWANALPTPAR